jgi:hypothetical protein
MRTNNIFAEYGAEASDKKREDKGRRDVGDGQGGSERERESERASEWKRRECSATLSATSATPRPVEKCVREAPGPIRNRRQNDRHTLSSTPARTPSPSRLRPTPRTIHQDAIGSGRAGGRRGGGEGREYIKGCSGRRNGRRRE